jgi:hypothetical protein
MKCSSLKHSRIEIKILPLGDIRARIGPMMRSPHLLFTSGLPNLFPALVLTTGPHPIATTIAVLRHVCTQIKSTSKA